MLTSLKCEILLNTGLVLGVLDQFQSFKKSHLKAQDEKLSFNKPDQEMQ